MVIKRDEKVNNYVLDYILDNKEILPKSYDDNFKIQVINNLIEYKRKSKGGVFTATYSERGATLEGRSFSKLSLQNFPCEVRNSLAISKYYDIDIVNAQHSFYLSFCKKNNLKHENLENYVINRSKLLKQSNLKKIDITKYINGDFVNDFHPEWLKGMKEEYNIISEILVCREETLHKHIIKKAKKEGKNYNIKGKIISQYYQIHEKIIINEALKWCEANNFVVGTIIHDGFLLEKDERILNEIENLNEYIKLKGYDLNFIIKKMEKILNIPNEILYKTKKDYQQEEKEKYKNLKDKFEKKNSKILNPLVWITTDINGNKCFEKNNNFKAKYIDWSEAVKNGRILKFSIWTEGGKPKTFIENYINDPEKKLYDSIDFIPNISLCPENIYNLFDGFNFSKLEIIDKTPEDEKRFKKLLEHIKFIVNDNTENVDEYFNYLIQFFAHIILNPMEKTKVLPVLKSPEGYGKNILTDFIGRDLMNDKYHLETRDAKKEIFGDFNGIMSEKLFVVFDETDPEESKFFYDKLKGEITNNKLILKKKGIENTTIKSFTQYIATTNNELPFKLSKTNRRFVLFECTQDKPNYKYFEDLAFGKNAIMKDKRIQSLFIDYLRNIYNPDFNFSIFPKSKFYDRSYELCKVPIDDFLNKFYQEHFFDAEPFFYKKGKKKDFYTVQLKTLYEEYKIFLNDNSGELISQLKFKSLILENNLFKIERNNQGAELLFKKDELKIYLEKNNIFENFENPDFTDDEE